MRTGRGDRQRRARPGRQRQQSDRANGSELTNEARGIPQPPLDGSSQTKPRAPYGKEPSSRGAQRLCIPVICPYWAGKAIEQGVSLRKSGRDSTLKLVRLKRLLKRNGAM